MNSATALQRLDHVLNELSEALDVPPSRYRDAKDRYDAVGAWLDAEDSSIRPFRPSIYPQGSFALGTAVKPLGEDDYDVDAVCLLEAPPDGVTQQDLKRCVGDRLKHPGSRYKGMIEPPGGGRRCWTIRYADASRFHLDVLPAIPDDYDAILRYGVPVELARDAIRLTDRRTWLDPRAEWPRSNPKGYASWFKGRMSMRLNEAKLALLKSRVVRADVEEIEDFEVRTPLQRLVQLLKRHRDVRYGGDDDKPVSIIITTLAAKAYDNEATLAEAMTAVVPRLRYGIEQQNGDYVVLNPVDPRENFADKWKEKPRKAQVFFEWLEVVEREHAQLLTEAGLAKADEYLLGGYGYRLGSTGPKTASETASALGTVGRAAAVAGPAVLAPRKSARAERPRIDFPSKPSKPWTP
ncbi:MAG: nucleotidyltransferase [Chloroflexi bacterium]|nr:nucleotidyltransferase [Chloroflexota bacterium]